MLLLGGADDFKSLAIPDGYPIEDAVPIVVLVWGNPTTPPEWVASDSSAMAAAVSNEFGGVPVRSLAQAYEE